ncbi:hypothetical protein F5J12DRAFT_548172 [Pisolithus orientalis]|uniref:uncharacterized protein n=1 Tax=Pisolithus orientalis TaxID=936130 RepID=UPI0022257E2C|nr:uncharacterized protein F5J12DRAFT_548172 [Pisolithus orientalis]KAI6012713.1 hypothetical protein F5J12DRAFT_548172 [Pisolithus orientalis]
MCVIRLIPSQEMSSATDTEATVSAFVNNIHPSFDFIIANTAFSACLFTLCTVLFALSTRESRRRVVFRLNVFAICIVLTMGVLVGLTNGKAIVDPYNPLPTSVYFAGVAFSVFPSLPCDSILLTRLFALYPLGSTPLATLIKIFAFPACIKCARVVVLTHFLINYVKSASVEGLTQDEATTWFRNPNLIAEWTMQIADNAYSVILFLYNLHVRTSWVKSAGGMPARIRQIFYISAANFIFPLIFNIALIIFVITDQSFTITGLLLLTNNYVTVMGVLCATLWFSRPEWARSWNAPLSDDILIFSLNPDLRRVHGTGRNSGGEIIVVGKRSATPGTADSDTGPVTNCRQSLTGADKNFMV